MAVKQKITTFNNETGQIYHTLEKGMYNPFDPERGYNFRYKSISIKSYLDIPLPSDFSDSEIGKIFRLSRSIYATSNMLGKRANSYVTPLTQEDIIKIFGLKDRQGRALMKKILKHKVIKKVILPDQENNCFQYYFNPIYFFSATYINLQLYLTFQDELNRHLPKDVITKYLDQMEKTGTPRPTIGN